MTSHRVPEKTFVQLNLKVLLQEASISTGVARQFLHHQNAMSHCIHYSTNGAFQIHTFAEET